MFIQPMTLCTLAPFITLEQFLRATWEDAFLLWSSVKSLNEAYFPCFSLFFLLSLAVLFRDLFPTHSVLSPLTWVPGIGWKLPTKTWVTTWKERHFISWEYLKAKPGLPRWLRGWRICLECGRCGFDPWDGKSPGGDGSLRILRGESLTPAFLLLLPVLPQCRGQKCRLGRLWEGGANDVEQPGPTAKEAEVSLGLSC